MWSTSPRPTDMTMLSAQPIWSRGEHYAKRPTPKLLHLANQHDNHCTHKHADDGDREDGRIAAGGHNAADDNRGKHLANRIGKVQNAEILTGLLGSRHTANQRYPSHIGEGNIAGSRSAHSSHKSMAGPRNHLSCTPSMISRAWRNVGRTSSNEVNSEGRFQLYVE